METYWHCKSGTNGLGIQLREYLQGCLPVTISIVVIRHNFKCCAFITQYIRWTEAYCVAPTNRLFHKYFHLIYDFTNIINWEFVFVDEWKLWGKRLWWRFDLPIESNSCFGKMLESFEFHFAFHRYSSLLVIPFFINNSSLYGLAGQIVKSGKGVLDMWTYLSAWMIQK